MRSISGILRMATSATELRGTDVISPVMSGVFFTFSTVSRYSAEYCTASGTTVPSACLMPTTLSPPIP